VIGRSDAIVSPHASRMLASRFRAPVIVEHAGGHTIPGTPDVTAAVTQFLRDRRADSRPPMTPTPDVPIDVPLWPGRARPAMRMFVPTDMTQPRPAMVIFRGGGYSSPNGSGAGTGAWVAQHGMVAFEVDYGTRITQSFYPQPFADGARAIRLVRAHAREWGIDPKRVGVLGYSAGGHLASLLGTQPSLWTSPDDDLASTISARPDLVVLAYPLLSFVDGYEPGAFMGSVENFFGRTEVSEPERRRLSSELHVESTHPPVFLWTTADDNIVPASQSEEFAAACRSANVPITFLLFPHGPHAMGLALDDRGEVGTWTTHLLRWLDQQWGTASSHP
jgi:acetyl esterase/lipase